MSKLKSTFSIMIFRLVGLLPLSSARLLGSVLGYFAYLFNTRMAQVTKTNIAMCLPTLSANESKALIKSSLKETGKTAAEVCVLWSETKSPLPYIQNVIGEHRLKELYSEGKGLIVLAPHLGNWEILGHYLETIGHVTNLYQPPKLKELDPLIRRSRSKAGCELVPADVRGVALLLKSLQSGGISGILPDQNPNELKSGEFIPFFGTPALTVSLVHKLIKRTGCNVVFAFGKRVEHGFELIFRDAPEDIYSKNVTQALTALNLGIEALVLEAPEQYQWEYKRFKYVPEGGTQKY